jgi:hypothetical protein
MHYIYSQEGWFYSNSFADIATDELPSPYADLSQIIASFKLRGFDERRGGHSLRLISNIFYFIFFVLMF